MNIKQIRRDAEKECAEARKAILSIVDSAEGEATNATELRQVMALLARGTPYRAWFEARGVIE